MLRPKSAAGKVLMFGALTGGIQSSRHNQEEVMTTKELYELHLNYTQALRAEPHNHIHTLDIDSEQQVFMYCRQTGVLFADEASVKDTKKV